METIRDAATGKSWATPRELISYVKATYHGYLRLALPHLDRLMDRVANEHVVPIGLMDRLRREFTALADALDLHITRQESRLFPQICQIRVPVGEVSWAFGEAQGLRETMEQTARENCESLEMADRVVSYLRGAAWKDKGRLVCELTYGVSELREDLAEHLHLETEVLFPAVSHLLDGQTLAL